MLGKRITDFPIAEELGTTNHILGVVDGVIKRIETSMLGGGEVNSVNGKTGDVILDASDIGVVEEGGVYKIARVTDYLYEAYYDTPDYAYAQQYFDDGEDSIFGGACSAVRKGNLVGRNFDWTYDESAEFIVSTQNKAGLYATIGVSGGIKDLTADFVDSGEKSDLYKIVPFCLLDGINEYGLFAEMNVVPLDKEENIAIPTGEVEADINGMMLVRYVIDHFKTAQEATSFISEHMRIWFSDKIHDAHYELHYLIADATHTYIVEFVDNAAVVTEVSERPYMTNFYLDGVTLNSDGTVYTPYTQDSTHDAISTNGITDNGSGLERWNMIVNEYDSIEDKDDMRSLMTSLKYTNAYTITDTEDVWYTEFVGISDLTCGTPYSEFASTLAIARQKYADRSRDDEQPIWQTVHSSVYDLSTKELYVVVQEQNGEYSFSKPIGISSIASEIGEISELETTAKDNLVNAINEIKGVSLPTVTSADNGKVLCVVDGVWAAVAIGNAEEASY